MTAYCFGTNYQSLLPVLHLPFLQSPEEIERATVDETLNDLDRAVHLLRYETLLDARFYFKRTELSVSANAY